MEKRRNRDALLDDQTPVIPNSALLFFSFHNLS